MGNEEDVAAANEATILEDAAQHERELGEQDE
jgi:hypothetical protein